MTLPRTVLLLAGLLAVSASAVAAPGPATLTLYNESEFVVTHVYIDVCEADEFTDDLLGNEVLEPGESLEVEMDPGCWDFRALVENDVVLDTYTYTVRADQELEWVISGGDRGRSTSRVAPAILEFSNRSSRFVVEYLYVAECGSGNWGDDMLDPDEVLGPGDQVNIELEPACWDVKVVLNTEQVIHYDGGRVRSGEVLRKWVEDAR